MECKASHFLAGEHVATRHFIQHTFRSRSLENLFSKQTGKVTACTEEGSIALPQIFFLCLDTEQFHQIQARGKVDLVKS